VPKFVGRRGDRQFFHEEGDRGQRLVLDGEQKAPVVPSEKRRVENAQKVEVARRDE
jgi:hypothetical protein